MTKTNRNPDNDRLTIRAGDIKKDMIEFANRYGVSLAWIVKKSWELFKNAVSKGEIKL